MANARNANTYYIDTQYATNEELVLKNVSVLGVIVTATSANAVLLLTNADASEAKKVDLRVATSGATEHFDFSESPILFTSGIRPKTLTNAVATVIIQGGGQA